MKNNLTLNISLGNSKILFARDRKISYYPYDDKVKKWVIIHILYMIALRF